MPEQAASETQTPPGAIPVPTLILHWNRPEECLRTVNAFLAQGIPLQISVIDNHSDSEALQALKAGLPDGVRLVALDENRGWGAAFNIAMRDWLAGEGSEFCLIAAHDATPGANCLEMLLGAIAGNPRIGIVCPEYGYPAVPRFTRLRSVRDFQVDPRAKGTVEAVDVPFGTLFGLRRQCI